MFARDSYVGSSGDLLQSHAPEVGGPWVKHPGSLTNAALTGLTPGTVRPTTATLALYYATGAPASADYTVTGDLTFAGGTLASLQTAVIGRCDPSASTYYFFGILDSRFSLYKFVAGSGVGLWQAASVGITVGQTRTFALQMVGTTLTCLVDGSVVHTQTDSSVTAAGKAGVYIYSPEAPGDATGLQLGAFSASDFAAPVVVPITDSNMFFSPYNWYKSGSTYAQTQVNGAYLKAGFTGTSISLNVDVSPLAGVTGAGNWPVISYSVDDGPLADHQLTSGDTAIPLASGLTSGTHTVFVITKAHVQDFATWVNPDNVTRVTGLTLDAGAATAAPTLRTKGAIFFGDSISDCLRMISASDAVAGQDSYLGWPQVAARALDAEVGVIGFGGTGWLAGFNNVPQFYDASDATNQSWDKYFAGQSRLVNGLFAPAPDLIATLYGTNDPNNAGNAAAVQGWLSACRAAASNSWIFICVPPNGRARSAITAGVAAYLTANPGDTKAKLIDLGTTWQSGIDAFAATASTTDGLHWRASFHARAGAGLAAAISDAMIEPSPTPPAIEGQVAVTAAGTTLRLRCTTGTAVVLEIEDEEGDVWDGSAYVPYVLADRASYATEMPESPAGSGRYVCQFPDSSPAGNYSWTAYVGDAPLGAGGGYWDGTTFGGPSADLGPVQAKVDAIQATLAGYSELSPAAVVTDPAPSPGGFIIALADGSPVPSTFVWRNSEAWFNGSGVLSGGKYPVATYTKLTATTARITFSPLLPLAPANGDTLLLG